MKTKSALLFCLFMLFAISNHAQNLSEVLQQAHQALNEGNCERASELYDQYKLVSNQSDIEFESNINYCYGEHCFNEEKYVQAIEWYLKSAKQENAYAEFNLGWMYRHGLGVPMDNNQAIKWYKLAAEHGNVLGQYNLGWIYDHVVECRDYEAAVKWYGLAAEQGLPQAQTNLGSMYYNGNGVIKDYKIAMKWFLLAADQEVPEAYHYLGTMYFYGNGVERNYEEALEWYNLAAKQEYVYAYNSIGYLYYQGYGNYSEALRWFLLASEKGDNHAPFNLGEMYEYGLGVGKDIEKAKQYYQLADKRGNWRVFYLKPWAFVKEEPILLEKPRIEWPYIPSTFDQSQFVLKAKIKSASKIEYCKLYLNGVEVQEDNAPGGSSIVEDQKDNKSHDITINRTLVLREGKNTIRIKVKNAGGETDEERTIEFKPEANQEKAVIVWNDLPLNTTESRLELDATVKSTVKDVTCRVMLNGEEVLRLAKGSSIVENSKEPEYKYKVKVQRTLNLKENIMNTIVIEVKDAQGGLLKSEQKQVYYSKPTLATIEWGSVPSMTDEKQFTLRAQIKSENPIEYYSILKDEKVLKRVEMASFSAPGGSSIVEDPKNVKAGYTISVEESVELAEGDNGFVIEVKNVGGILRSAPMTVKYKHKEKRIALVIGNQNYNDEKMKLTCPSNDANAVAARFRKLGFDEVMQMNNLNKDNMKSIINGFRAKSVNYDAVVVYYSGHGVQLNQINYMIPTDFDFSNGNIMNDCVALTYLLRDLGEDRMKIVVYDACRTQPRPKGDNTDIDVMNNVNIFIAYASSVGQPSYEDLDSSYSIYTAAFLKMLEEPNLELGKVFSKVNDIVRKKTAAMNVKQVPYIEGSIVKDFTFNKK